MIEEAMRNGTWVPPTPPTRLPRVDLSKKPELWEAYLGGGGWQPGGLGHGSGKELGIGTNWNFEYSKDWEAIKPVSADYAMALSSVPYSDPTHNPTPLPPPIPNPGPRPVILTTPADEENRRAAAIPTTPSLFTRARTFLNPPPPTFPLPASSPASSNGSNAHSTNISMTELTSNSPSTVRVTVLIAMPSLPSHSSSTPPSSFSSSLSQPKTSHPLHSSGLQPNDTHDEQPLPYLEMGVAEVAISPGNSSSWDAQGREGKTIYSRGSSYAEWCWERWWEKRIDFGLESVFGTEPFQIFLFCTLWY